MSTLEVSADGADPLEADLVEAGVYDSASAAAEHGLVVLAAGQPYWLVPGETGFRLLVEPRSASIVRAQLAAFNRESTRWPPPPITDPWGPRKLEILTPLIWSAGVLGVYAAMGSAPSWLDRGALDAQAVFEDGEWWRVVTALFLHAGPGHVIANALGGALVFTAVATTLGRLRGWLLILIAAALGNFAAAAVNYPAEYSSVGASTAIFAGVGLLVGRAVRIAWNSTHPHRWRAMFVPLAAGATVLALQGAGGERVDVGAHLTGFLAGLLLGFQQTEPGRAKP